MTGDTSFVVFFLGVFAISGIWYNTNKYIEYQKPVNPAYIVTSENDTIFYQIQSGKIE